MPDTGTQSGGTGEGQFSGSQGGGTLEDAQQAITRKAQDAAGTATRTARSSVSEQVDQRSTQAGQQVRQVASAFAETSAHLRDRGQGSAAGVVDQVADSLHRTADYLVEGDSTRFRRDFDRFGTQRPWMVVGVAAGVGFALTRLLKASAPSSQTISTTASQPQVTTPPETSMTTPRRRFQRSATTNGHNYADSLQGG